MSLVVSGIPANSALRTPLLGCVGWTQRSSLVRRWEGKWGPCLVSEMADGRIATACAASPPPQPVWLHRGGSDCPTSSSGGTLMLCLLRASLQSGINIFGGGPLSSEPGLSPIPCPSLFSHHLPSMTPVTESQRLTLVTTQDASHQHMQHGIAASLSSPASPTSSSSLPPLMQGPQPRRGGYLILLSLHCPIASLIWATFI